MEPAAVQLTLTTPASTLGTLWKVVEGVGHPEKKWWGKDNDAIVNSLSN